MLLRVIQVLAITLPIQNVLAVDDTDLVMQSKVKRMIKHAWNGYKAFAFGYDELQPISRSGYNWTQPYSYVFTAVDSLDTLQISGLQSEYQEAKELVLAKLNFDADPSTESKFNHFEWNIRVLGGLLSAYELDSDPRYIAKAKDLANRLLGAFDTKSGFPSQMFNLRTGKTDSSAACLASIGTLGLEFQYLSDITGNMTYQNKAFSVYKKLEKINSEIPGMYPLFLDTKYGHFPKPHTFGISANADSYYEYLIKLFVSTGSEYFGVKYDQAKDAVLKHVLVTDGEYYYLPDKTDGVSDKEFHHLSCFAGGMFSLGSQRKTANRSYELFVGQQITETCYQMYAESSNGLGGETATIQDGKVIVKDSSSHLRPEVVESLFYQYRFTKDTKYREYASKVVDALEKNSKVETGGYHGFENGNPKDLMESFFLAETLKYLYLIFSDSSLISLQEYVFNTEAHPISIRGHGRRKHLSSLSTI